MQGARDRDFLDPNILCLEHHVPIPYDSFTNPKLQDLFFLLGDFFFSYWGILFFLAGVSAPRCQHKLALSSPPPPPPPPQGGWAAAAAAAVCKVES